MKVKTSELTGAALDWAVAQAEGLRVAYHDDGITRCVMKLRGGSEHLYAGRFAPSTDWSAGGPVIERLIDDGFIHQKADWGQGIKCWRLKDGDQLQVQYGPTTLVAATRCFVMVKLGEVVDVPDCLIDSCASARH